MEKMGRHLSSPFFEPQPHFGSAQNAFPRSLQLDFNDRSVMAKEIKIE